MKISCFSFTNHMGSRSNVPSLYLQLQIAVPSLQQSRELVPFVAEWIVQIAIRTPRFIESSPVVRIEGDSRLYPEWQIRVTDKIPAKYDGNILVRIVFIGLLDSTIRFEATGDEYRRGVRPDVDCEAKVAFRYGFVRPLNPALDEMKVG